MLTFHDLLLKIHDQFGFSWEQIYGMTTRQVILIAMYMRESEAK